MNNTDIRDRKIGEPDKNSVMDMSLFLCNEISASRKKYLDLVYSITEIEKCLSGELDDSIQTITFNSQDEAIFSVYGTDELSTDILKFLLPKLEKARDELYDKLSNIVNGR